MNITDKKVIKCAVYTRKSTEEGLEQDFNSLHAQREACELYIKSQQHEGWVLVEKQYNDGGFSGGTLERPAIKQLFQDIQAGEVNIVVIYKVDRLTRSLMDFAKMVELFDKHLASFVSITQHFNTTTSMGRLTLNMLLSFAQFEREVTGERIRDKVAASKKKGIWMSGKAPIGYQLKDRKLLIDNNQVQKVRMIFDKYLELKSVPNLISYLKENNIKTKNENCFTKGALYHILQNKTYLGLITHKDKAYNGEHQSIIKNDIFEKAQRLLSQNRISEKCSTGSSNSSLLAGKIFDDRGNSMSPSHSNTRNRKYRYYVSQAITQFRRHEAGSISKIPAGEIEEAVIEEIKAFLFNTKNIQTYIEHYDIHKQKELLLSIKSLQKDIKSKFDSIFIRTILNKIILYKEKIIITLCRTQLLKALEAITYNVTLPEELKKETSEPIFITKEIQITQITRNGSILIISDSKRLESSINNQLVKAIAKSYYWNKLFLSGEVKSSIDIQKMENLSDNKNIKGVLRLRFLAPDIVETILNGTQPLDMNVQKLLAINTLDWNEQRKILNI
ncbi:MAG: recombinase family protein [Candidatus Gastranaerophilales bacterium]|nr:recombinase family protein [Candidatus Gastranaerophilales bacterium]